MPIVSLPVCEWCGSIEAYKCRICERYSCWECMTIYEDETCEHKLPQLGINKPTWSQDDFK